MADLKTWNVEDEAFWNDSGKSIATRNLWISIPCLLAGFGVWMQWGVLTVQMLNLGFPYEQSELFTLTAIAGLTGATLRIPSSFFIRLCGGRNTIAFTTALLILPSIGAGIALQSKDTPLWVFQLLALLSGFGGGNFASSMSNINFFFPKRMQGYALGMNAGLGNFGVTTMQVVVPLVMTFAVFGALGGESMVLEATSGTLIGKIPAGSDTWIQNAGFIWLVTLVPLSLLAWWGMNNISTAEVTPRQPGALSSFGIMSGMLLIGFITALVGLWLLLPEKANGSGFGVPKEIVLLLVIAATVFLLKLLPGVNSKMLKDVKMDPKRMKHIEAIVLSMTPQERKKPEILNGSRRSRIAKGCGRPVSEVNKLLEQFRDMQKMMKKMGGGPGGGGGKGGGGMPRMPFGGGGGMFGGMR